MKKWIVLCVSVVALALVAEIMIAQDAGGEGDRPGARPPREGRGPRDGDRPRRGGEEGEGGEGAEGGRDGRHRRPPMPLLRALDADRDGALSADEIANASKALLKLDKDNNGALSREELRPPRPPREGEGEGGKRGGEGDKRGGDRDGKGGKRGGKRPPRPDVEPAPE